MHQGVGLLITDKSRELFFIQKKDRNYPVEKWIGGFSFWGGAIEDNDLSPYEALIREIQEELTTELDYKQIKFVNEFLVKSDSNYTFYLFELTVNEKTLDTLKYQKVNEGNCDVVTKKALLTGKWIWGLEQVINQHFEN